jgi:peroxiredoxin Q/BCP
MPKRVTYLINEKLEIAAVFSDLFENKGHIAAMLKTLKS